MTTDPFEYDVALSFAGEDRDVAHEFARLLAARDIKVLRAEYQTTETGGSDFLTQIAELYRTRARYCVLFFSRNYPLQAWTEGERTFAREHALRDADEYLIPIRLDDADIPGLAEATAAHDLRQGSMESIVNELHEKLRQARERSGAPSQSHDLRSGNVPKHHQGRDDE